MGFKSKNLEGEDHCHIALNEAPCRYHHPARYDEVLRVRTRIADGRSRVIKFAYEVFHAETGRLLATGETTHVICGRDGRPRSLPAKYRSTLTTPALDASQRSV